VVLAEIAVITCCCGSWQMALRKNKKKKMKK
jgi:hypothetical protein